MKCGEKMLIRLEVADKYTGAPERNNKSGFQNHG